MAHPAAHTAVTREMKQCIDECTHCHAMCTETVQHCFELGGHHARPSHIALLLDCAQICQTSADFMLRGSERHRLTCRACAEICRMCADECERMADGDRMTEQCAEACRSCAESCERMARGR